MIVALALAIAGALVIARWWLARRWLVVTVHGASMSPTLRDGERLVVRRLGKPPVRHASGDIVVFRVASPAPRGADDPGHRVKRIAAVAGEPVPAWARGALAAADDAVVPPGRVIVAGDNARSQDSRQLGYIPVDAIIAIVPARPEAP